MALELPLGRSWLYLAPLSLHLAPPGPLRGPFWAEIDKTIIFRVLASWGLFGPILALMAALGAGSPRGALGGILERFWRLWGLVGAGCRFLLASLVRS